MGDFEMMEAVDQAMDMFGTVLPRETIAAVLEACGGNLPHAIDVIVHMTENVDTNNVPFSTPEKNLSQEQCRAPTSYASTSKSTGAIAKATRPSRTLDRKQPLATSIPKVQTHSPRLNEQLKKIIAYHKQGYRTLVVMRGVPGSGKTMLARQIVDLTVGGNPVNYKSHIFSSDDYFSLHGAYVYNAHQLDQAHKWNQNSVTFSLRQGLSPVIVDNTNTKLWEMEAYIFPGIENGYFLEIVEPHTPWARNCHQLSKKNVHNVSYAKIRQMLDRYEAHHSSENILKQWRLHYPLDKRPPVLRNAPPFSKANENISETNTFSNDYLVTLSNTAAEITNRLGHLTPLSAAQSDKKGANEEQNQHVEKSEEEKRRERLLESEKQLEEIEKLEHAWETGAQWIDHNEKNENVAPPWTQTGPKPQRDIKSREHSGSRSGSLHRATLVTENLHIPKNWQDIGNCSVPTWNHNVSPKVEEPSSVAEKITSGTSVEIGDTDTNNPNVHLLSARPRDINFYYVPPISTKIPQKRMLDKSSMTNDELDSYRCKHQDKHFIAFRKMFKQFAEADLKDIFEKCCGDVHWASEIVLDGVENNKILQTDDEQQMPDVHEDLPDCDCISAYCIVPRFSEPALRSTEVTQLSILEHKKKKDKALSESSVQVKRQIEKTVNISDHHYSNHSLKLRRLRRGESEQDHPNLPPIEMFSVSSTSNPMGNNFGLSPAPFELVSLGSEDDCSDPGELDETVNVTLGADFINQLNDHFNNQVEIKNAQHIIPVVSMPKALLNQLNALWLESLAHQMETQNKFSEVLLKEDEEFAKQLAEKEAEIERAGEEPAVPDFKEIMDMDLAMTLYNRDVSEWKNSEPTDLASKLSREKLYNLFPEYDKDILSEILLAHDNNFQSTVEVLLTSSGKAEILEEKNGVNKFVMNKELERQEKALDEERLKLQNEEEWPVLGGTEGSSKVELETVNDFRKEAQQHLDRRNFNYNKAQDYFRRGMTQVASYYATLADFHKSKFDQANHYAASSLIRVNAASHDTTTLDLHHLFVAEATQALDLFLDHHIGQLVGGAGGAAAAPRELFLITGRGLHSRAGPRVKPAVRRRLTQRGLKSQHVNPGLLKVTVSPETKLTHQLE